LNAFSILSTAAVKFCRERKSSWRKNLSHKRSYMPKSFSLYLLIILICLYPSQ